MLYRTFIAALALSLLIPLNSPTALGETSTRAPAAVVEEFQNTLLSVMKAADKLGFKGRFERLEPAVTVSHDLQAIAQIAVGHHWDQLSDQQRTRLVDTFTTLSIATYAHRFDGYSGETFETHSSDKLSTNVAGVHSVFVKTDGEEIRFDYLLRQSDDQWRIVNIVVDGVSDLALKRSEYTEILDSDGFDALLQRLNEKIADYSQ